MCGYNNVMYTACESICMAIVLPARVICFAVCVNSVCLHAPTGWVIRSHNYVPYMYVAAGVFTE